jgi:hypothetical protein
LLNNRPIHTPRRLKTLIQTTPPPNDISTSSVVTSNPALHFVRPASATTPCSAPASASTQSTAALDMRSVLSVGFEREELVWVCGRRT